MTKTEKGMNEKLVRPFLLNKGEITYGKEKLQICRYPVTH